MYLSRMRLNTDDRKTAKALISPNLIHGAVETALGNRRERALWRVDTLAGERYLLLLSESLPDMTVLTGQFGFPDSEMSFETRDYSALLDRIRSGDRWHFRLKANPVKSVSNGSHERGKVLGHVTPAQQSAWLLDRAEKHGFSLGEDTFTVVGSEWLKFHKGSDGHRPVTILAVTFEGILTVTDETLFKETLTNGFGRGKAYGLGLLTVAGRI